VAGVLEILRQKLTDRSFCELEEDMQSGMKQKGQGLVEYALIIVPIAIGLMLVMTASGVNLTRVFKVACSFGVMTGCDAALFQENFDNLSAWNIVSGTWKTVAGKLLGGPNEGRIFHDMTQSDYLINIDAATLLSGSGYGVFFRASNTSAVNGYSFQYDPGYGEFILRKWVNGAELAPFARVKPPSGYNWLGTARNIQVSVKGSTYTVFVDGTQVLQASDSTYATGGIGLRTWDSTSSSFDSITVQPVP
jgi:hypothetical protein